MIFFVLAFLSFSSAQTQVAPPSVQDGAYIMKIAGCRDCHSQSPSGPLSGGNKLVSPFGTFYTPNITPDDVNGIGRWSYEDFYKALRFGISPSGENYYPSFPYRAYTKMTDHDLASLYLYLMTLPRDAQSNRAHKINVPFNQRWLLNFWKLLFFNNQDDLQAKIKIGTGEFEPDPERSTVWNRGAYVAEALMHCTECHTPRNQLGALQEEMWMSGAALGDIVAPNITPSESALGHWSHADWQKFLTSGFTPEMKSIRGEMVYVLQNTSALTNRDREALIEYMMNLKPIDRGDDQ